MTLSPTEARPQAEALAARLAAHAAAIAPLIAPPFTPARKRKIEQAFSESALDFSTLSRLVLDIRLKAAFKDSQTYGYFTGLAEKLALWNEARATLRRVTLVKEPVHDPENHPLLAAYAQSFTLLHRHFLDQAAALMPPDWPHPFHRDIALPFTRFLLYAAFARRLARALGREGPLHFVDVGCGVGLKLLQAASFYERVSGIEFEPHRARAAENWLGRTAQVLTADALTFQGYGAFDVIYAYKPLQDDALMRQTEDRMIEQARPGTVLIMPYMDFHNRHEELGCHQIKDAVYIAKASSAEQARALSLLPHVGEALVFETQRDEGFSAPLRAALRRWGHLS